MFHVSIAVLKPGGVPQQHEDTGGDTLFTGQQIRQLLQSQLARIPRFQEQVTLM